MNILRVLDLCVLCVWMTIDGIVVFGRRVKPAQRADRLSMLGIIVSTWIGMALALTFGFGEMATLGTFTTAAQIIGLVIMGAGILVRSVAIAQLGRYHTPVVAIQEGHRVFDDGLYRHIRHPSYLGACVAFLGFGLGLGSWLGALLLMLSVLIGYAYRIRVEERALLGSLGEAYAAYQRRTCRLVPGIY